MLRGVVAVAVVVLAGALSSAGYAYVIRTTPADTATASRALLRWTDLPSHTFWRGGTVPVQASDMTAYAATLGGPCASVRFHTASLVISGQAEADFKASNNTQSVDNAVFLLQNQEMVDRDVRQSAAMFSRVGLRCEQLLYNHTGSTTIAYRVTRLPVPRFGVHGRAYRVYFTFRQPLFGHTAYGLQDFVYLTSGRIESNLVLEAALGSSKADRTRREELVDAAEVRLIGIAAHRMRLAE